MGIKDEGKRLTWREGVVSEVVTLCSDSEEDLKSTYEWYIKKREENMEK